MSLTAVRSSGLWTWIRTARPHGLAATLATGVGLVLALAGVVGAIAHFRTPTGNFSLVLSAGSPYLFIAAGIGCLLLALARVWLLLVLGLAPFIVGAFLELPLYASADPPARSVPVVAMTLNLHKGEADAAQVVGLARTRRVQFLTLEEITPGSLTDLRSAGLDRLLPNSVVQPDVHGLTTGVWSLTPLSQNRSIKTKTFHLISALTTPPQLTHSIDVAAIHVAGPSGDAGNWRTALAQLPNLVESVPATSCCGIIAGDFGASWDVSQFRDALDTGYRDGAEQAGAGVKPTYPADRWYGPLVAIDHVLTRDAVATAVDTFNIRGSDHRAVVAVIAVPR